MHGGNYSELQDEVRKTLAAEPLENETLAMVGNRCFARILRSVSAFNNAFDAGRPPPGHYLDYARFIHPAAAKKSRGLKN